MENKSRPDFVPYERVLNKPDGLASRLQRRSNHNKVQVRPETLEYADFVVVLSTLSSQEMKLSVVLEFYRARWQVELAFKRLKSLLQMGQLPKKKEASCRAWMQGKILTALLIERLLCEAVFFPVGLSTLKSSVSGICYKEFRDALLVQLAMPLNLTA